MAMSALGKNKACILMTKIWQIQKQQTPFSHFGQDLYVEVMSFLHLCGPEQKKSFQCHISYQARPVEWIGRPKIQVRPQYRGAEIQGQTRLTWLTLKLGPVLLWSQLFYVSGFLKVHLCHVRVTFKKELWLYLFQGIHCLSATKKV